MEPGYTKYFKILDDEDNENEEEIESKIENNLSEIPAGEYQIEVSQANFYRRKRNSS